MRYRDVLSGHAGPRLPEAGPSRRALVGVAAVVLLAAGCAPPVTAPGTEPGTGPGTGPTTAALAAAQVEPTPGADRSEHAEIDPGPAPGQTPARTPRGGEPWSEAATTACAAVVDAGMAQVAQTADAGGVTSFWSDGHRWASCDSSADTAPTVIRPTGVATGFDERSLALSSVLAAGGAPRFVAGGRLPRPVRELGYTFPDGHTELARFVSSKADPDEVWWAVTYTPTDGPLRARDTTDLGPVTITVVGAAAEAFRVPWEDLQRSE